MYVPVETYHQKVKNPYLKSVYYVNRVHHLQSSLFWP